MTLRPEKTDANRIIVVTMAGALGQTFTPKVSPSPAYDFLTSSSGAFHIVLLDSYFQRVSARAWESEGLCVFSLPIREQIHRQAYLAGDRSNHPRSQLDKLFIVALKQAHQVGRRYCACDGTHRQANTLCTLAQRREVGMAHLPRLAGHVAQQGDD